MADIFSDPFSMDMGAFCLAICAIIAFFRQTIEVLFPKIVNKPFWTDLIVPASPIILGGVGAVLLAHYLIEKFLEQCGQDLCLEPVPDLLVMFFGV